MEKFKLTVKDVIYIITIVISMAGVWFTMKNKVDNLESQIKNHNLQLIEYKLDQLDKQLNKILEALE